MIAANINECISWSMPAVTHWAQSAADNLYEHLQNWETTFLQFLDNNENQRTVRNWKIPANYLLASIPNANQDQSEYISDVARVVFGACSAARFAQAAGRITNAQLTQFVGDWNTYWGF